MPPRIEKSFIVNTVLIIVAMIVSYHAARMVRNVVMTREQSAEMTHKIEQLKLKKQELEAELAGLKTKEAVEREAKERLNLKKPGEEVVVVVPEKKDNEARTQPKSLWAKIESFFGRQ